MGRFSSGLGAIGNNIFDVTNVTFGTKDINALVKEYFRYYQQDMWNNFLSTFDDTENKSWLFPAPTGCGKTEIFKFMIPYLIYDKLEKSKEPSVFALVCHRIGLIHDLGKRIIPIIRNKSSKNSKDYIGKSPAGCDIGDKVDFIIVNSGNKFSVDFNGNFMDKKEDEESFKQAAKEVTDKIKNALHLQNFNKDNWTSLHDKIKMNKQNGIHTMFICLYQSLGDESYSEVLQSLNMDFMVADECHATNSLGVRVFENCCKFYESCKKRFFFTASPAFDPRDERFKNSDDLNQFQYVQPEKAENLKEYESFSKLKD